MAKTNALDVVRKAAEALEDAEREVGAKRRRRDQAILAATRAPDGGRPSFTNEQVGQAAGITEPQVRKIRSRA